MPTEVRLTKPELYKSLSFKRSAGKLRSYVLSAGRQAQSEAGYQPNIALLVRTMNDRENLQKLIEHIDNERKDYAGRIDLIVVDTESKDGTKELAQAAGGTLVNMKQKDFSYPKSINLGMAKVKPDVEAVFITVGHAFPALSNCLAAAARHFKDKKVVAVYTDQLPGENASFWEQIIYLGSPNIQRRMSLGPHITPGKHAGLTQATGSMVRLSAWKEHHFDEAYGHGGEDYVWGLWALKRGYRLVFDPAVAMHHTHGLGPINFARQLRYWLRIILKPGDFDQQKLYKHRPDLRN